MEVEKILQNQVDEDRMVFEYAECRKMVHSLEQELQIVVEKNQLLISEIETKTSSEGELKRQIADFERKNLNLQEQHQRIEFDYRMTI